MLEGSESSSISISGRGHSLPPEWVDIVETIQKDIEAIKDNIRKLQKLHAARLKVTFGGDEAEQERDIEILTQEITRLLKRCEQGLKRIATVGNAKGTNLPQQERVVRLNVMRSLATELQGLSKHFRHCQKDFLIRLKGQEEIGNEFFVDDSESKQPLSFEDALDRGLTPQQTQQLEEMNRTASEREQEIIKIAQSINDLATIFRELSVLVIEQGTILDRIDYNVEQTLVKVKHGTKELVKAENYSKKMGTMKCIFALICLIFILVAVLVIQHTDFSSDDDKK